MFCLFFLVYVNNIAMSIYTQSYLDMCFKLSWLYAQGNGCFVGLACWVTMYRVNMSWEWWEHILPMSLTLTLVIFNKTYYYLEYRLDSSSQPRDLKEKSWPFWGRGNPDSRVLKTQTALSTFPESAVCWPSHSLDWLAPGTVIIIQLLFLLL